MVGKQPSIFNLTKFNGVVLPYRKKVVKKNKGKIEKVILTLLNSKLKAHSVRGRAKVKSFV